MQYNHFKIIVGVFVLLILIIVLIFVAVNNGGNGGNNGNDSSSEDNDDFSINCPVSSFESGSHQDSHGHSSQSIEFTDKSKKPNKHKK